MTDTKPHASDVKVDAVDREAEERKEKKTGESNPETKIDVAPPMPDPMADARPVEEPKGFVASMHECSEVLADVPDALDFGVKRTDTDRHYYAFDNVSAEAKRARERIAKTLRRVYDAGAYSYRDFAERLRVPSLSIQAILDEEFIEANNL